MSEPSTSDAAALGLPRRWFGDAARDAQLTRFVLLRGLGFIYFVAFWIAVRQGLPLLGSHGLMPIDRFLGRVEQTLGAADAV